MNTRSIKKDIAIIGMSGKFPGSKNILELWKNLVQGNELIHFYTDSELHERGLEEPLISNPNYIKSSAMINDPGSFDNAFFGYTKEEAAMMDPQIRIMHEQTWLALENAGCNSFNYKNKIGCFISATDNINWRTHTALTEAPNVNKFLISQIADRTSISRLISYSLDLRGPSYFVDTACSSSLVAIHQACRSLLLKECTAAVAGGISVSSSESIGYMHEEGMIFSKDGHCRAFDNEATGTVGGEGVGVVILKRLEDALNDRDHIYSVIRATAVNNDGNQKVGYTAPSITGQYDCIKTAQRIAGVDPTEITYIEAHGTGTKLGDPIEIEALNKAFNYDQSHQCGIGSIKTNLGHLDAAAGVAGLIKATMALYNKELPPSLHFKNANPEINFDSGPFYVNANFKKWESDQTRFAGVSSFGIGGTNAHAILQEPPSIQAGDESKSYQLILCSAKTKSAVENFQLKLKTFLEQDAEVHLANLAYTLKTGRNQHRYRRFIIGKDVAEITEQLKTINCQKANQKVGKNGIVFMFSGQGSQYLGMGKQIYDQFPDFKAIMDDGFDILKNETGLDYKDIIGYGSGENPKDDRINNTANTQPLLFLVEYAFATLLLKMGVQPSQMIGHSLGEYVAACISGVFSFSDGLKLVLKRGELMAGLAKGDMLHVSISADEIRELIPNKVSIAAINTADSCVISGTADSIQKVSDDLKAKKIEYAVLKTSHAFHSEMMDPILDAFEFELKKINFSEPKLPFISGTTGLPIENEQAQSPKYWVNHLRETVNFAKGLDFITTTDCSTCIEIGAARTLSSFLRQHKNYDSNTTTLAVMRHPKESKDDVYYLLKALGTLWNTGINLDWNVYYSGDKRYKVNAPTYVFDRVIFPAKVNPIARILALKEGGQIASVPLKTIHSDYNNEPEVSEQITEKPDVEADFQHPETITEKKLCELCESLFGYDEIGIKDDFFELGGDSLKAITLLKRIHQEFNIEIEMSVFFERSNIHELAEEIELAIEVKMLNNSDDKPSNSKQLRF